MRQHVDHGRGELDVGDHNNPNTRLFDGLKGHNGINVNTGLTHTSVTR